MPKFLEKKLEKEYPHDPHAVFGTMNKIGAMKGDKETKKGKMMEKKHENERSVKTKKHHMALKMGKGGISSLMRK